MSAPRQEPAADLPGVVFHAAVLRGRTAAERARRLAGVENRRRQSPYRRYEKSAIVLKPEQRPFAA